MGHTLSGSFIFLIRSRSANGVDLDRVVELSNRKGGKGPSPARGAANLARQRLMLSLLKEL